MKLISLGLDQCFLLEIKIFYHDLLMHKKLQIAIYIHNCKKPTSGTALLTMASKWLGGFFSKKRGFCILLFHCLLHGRSFLSQLFAIGNIAVWFGPSSRDPLNQPLIGTKGSPVCILLFQRGEASLTHGVCADGSSESDAPNRN